VAAIRAVGVRGDPCGAMRWTIYLSIITYFNIYNDIIVH